MTNPYSNLEKRAFWRTAVADRSLFDINELWRPKFDILPSTKVATYGSCFAQHIGRSLRQRGYQWLITEPAPHGLSEGAATRAGYGIFSSRTANIYTASLLLQWLSWASSKSVPPSEIWEDKGRFYDPFRPAIEPDGFETEEEAFNLLAHTISCFRSSIIDADFLVFTMGLTESWFDVAGFEYPMCPGTAAGTFNKKRHYFKTQDYDFILRRMQESLEIAKKLNPKLKFILTVSPVPLTATRSGKHVLVATIESKSILRSVAGKLANERDDCDYFPSYEIINSSPFGGIFFEPNKRSVNPVGVKFVMDSFFSGLNMPPSPLDSTSQLNLQHEECAELDEGCEEAMLEAYSRSLS